MHSKPAVQITQRSRFSTRSMPSLSEEAVMACLVVCRCPISFFSRKSISPKPSRNSFCRRSERVTIETPPNGTMISACMARCHSMSNTAARPKNASRLRPRAPSKKHPTASSRMETEEEDVDAVVDNVDFDVGVVAVVAVEEEEEEEEKECAEREEGM